MGERLLWFLKSLMMEMFLLTMVEEELPWLLDWRDCFSSLDLFGLLDCFWSLSWKIYWHASCPQ